MQSFEKGVGFTKDHDNDNVFGLLSRAMHRKHNQKPGKVTWTIAAGILALFVLGAFNWDALKKVLSILKAAHGSAPEFPQPNPANDNFF